MSYHGYHISMAVPMSTFDMQPRLTTDLRHKYSAHFNYTVYAD